MVINSDTKHGLLFPPKKDYEDNDCCSDIIVDTRF